MLVCQEVANMYGSNIFVAFDEKQGFERQKIFEKNEIVWCGCRRVCAERVFGRCWRKIVNSRRGI